MNKHSLLKLLLPFYLLVYSVSVYAQKDAGSAPAPTSGAEQNNEETPALTLESATETLQETVVSIWHDFISHIPYIVAGMLVLVITVLASMLVGRLTYKLTSRGDIRGSLRDLIQRLARILIWVLGLLLAAMVVFPGLTPAGALGGLGLASVAIGFAFKEIFENFFAGVLLLWKYPFEKGDFIECEDIMGEVVEISVRMSQVRKPDGELVVMPNSFLFKNPVFVLTNERFRRMRILTSVAYSEDANASIPIIEEAVKKCETVDNNSPIEVFLHGFGASSIDIEVTWWADPTPLGQRRSRGEVVGSIKEALDKAGIEIPFPYRTLTFKEPLSVLSGSESADRDEQSDTNGRDDS